MAAQGLLLGVAAGALFGVSDIAIKFLVDDVASGVLELISPWTVAALIASVVAFYASARGLQIGPGVEVIALTSVAANLTAIFGGILVFRDPVGYRSAGDHRPDARFLPGGRRRRPDSCPGPSHARSVRPPGAAKEGGVVVEPLKYGPEKGRVAWSGFRFHQSDTFARKHWH